MSAEFKPMRPMHSFRANTTLPTSYVKPSSSPNHTSESSSSREGQWLPMMEYAIQSGLSVSTLRRYIKANRIHHKMENGRYLLWMSLDEPEEARFREQQIAVLTAKVQEQQEQINELKMLVAIYEEKLFQKA